MATENARLRTDMATENARLRTDMATENGKLRVRNGDQNREGPDGNGPEGFGSLRAEMIGRNADLLKWLLVFFAAQTTAIAALFRMFR